MTKVLVIDDSPFIFKAIKKALTPKGFEVVDNASNGQIGLEMVQKYSPDIITLDVTMPVMDGIETARELLKLGYSSKIIMLSAMGDEALIEEAKSLGIQHFLSKPFKAEQMLEKVQLILEGKGSAV